MRKLFSGIMLLLSLFCISVSIYMLAGMKLEDQKSDNAFEQIREVFDQEYPEDSKDNSENESNINPGLLELHEKNPDCVGWIQIEDTHIDYPVMYHPEEKNYYLRKNFNQEYDISGTPFMLLIERFALILIKICKHCTTFHVMTVNNQVVKILRITNFRNKRSSTYVIFLIEILS